MVKQGVIEKIAAATTEEFYTPIPKGYKPGKTKYVITTGSVISGIGKGIFTSSLTKLFVDRGMKVAPIKLEAYLNVDAGTMNPYRHGEVFVLDDGLECDMDLGSYERFMDANLTKESFVTSGQIYQSIIKKERAGGYLGRDVQFIPHVTGEMKLVLRNLAMKTGADVVLVEIGGTVGDYENLFAFEAIRQLMYEEGEDNVCVINLTYILNPPSVGEFKSKAAQQGIKKMIELGLQPDIIICRSEKKIPDKIKEKISLNVNVPVEHVFGGENVESIYTLPLSLRKKGVDEAILKILDCEKRFKKNGDSNLEKWTNANLVKNPKHKITIGIAGKYTGLIDSYISILKALEHCEAATNSKIGVKWIETTDVEKGKKKPEQALKGIDGLIVPGGFGSRGSEGKIKCIKYAREKKIPYLGLCYGMQMAVIEFARNVCGLNGAHSTECDTKSCDPVICILPEQDDIEGLGGTLRLGGHDVVVEKGTLAHSLYGSDRIRERFRHRFNVNIKYIDALAEKGIIWSGRAPEKRIMQIMELPKSKHPFFLGTQFHPEFTSRPLKPNPLYLGFIRACVSGKK
ncbi:CTP synthase [Candidatus Micrarchaeota archaeon]|nr:CTP synthase [Candidatus Micrarchaeota archaeon]MBU1940034.1 CTP synthase [Candidatus Micrarchaeota archaeon]